MAPKSRRPSGASIVIRNLDPAVKKKLRVRGAQHGRSMEAEARAVLERSVAEGGPSQSESLYDRIRARLGATGGVDLEIPPRGDVRSVPDFD